MNLVHLHLILNHVPVFGVVFGLALLSFAAFRNSRELTRISLGLFVVIALATIPLYFTGEPSENAVENLPGVAKPIIEQHESAAAIAFGGAIALGVGGLAGLLLGRGQREVPRWVRSSVLCLALIAAGLMFWTANLGGQIRHSEIRRGEFAATTPATESERD
jgi:hypothetical protein